MMWSRIAAVVLVVAATLWIGSGIFGRRADGAASAKPGQAAEAAPRFKVAVLPVRPEMHVKTVTLSGHTEADNRASAVARTTGSIVSLKVRRGSRVNQGDVLAVLSDEAREAQVEEAAAMVRKRQADLDTKLPLINRGIVAANEKNQLLADLSKAEAELAMAQAEREHGIVRAPIAGFVSEVPVTTGQALQSNAMVAEVIALDPMLAVVEVAERQLGGIKVGDRALVHLVTGSTAEGTVRFISPTASKQTRTYRVDVELPNKAGEIADGVTAEVEFRLKPVTAARVPRSALTFTAEGTLGIRTVDESGLVRSLAVKIIEDAREEVWLSGLTGNADVIVQGQDFVKDGQSVDAVRADAPAAMTSKSE
jgi:membrane fusion protein, multidrug efflux system